MKLILKLIFFLFTSLLTIVYIGTIVRRMRHPEMGKAPILGYMIIGIVVIVLIALNIKWFSSEAKKIKR